MDNMMIFPDTWEEYEKSYGFNDSEEVYTNGARLIPSFRVKQWLEHLSTVAKKETVQCEGCIHQTGRQINCFGCARKAPDRYTRGENIDG